MCCCSQLFVEFVKKHYNVNQHSILHLETRELDFEHLMLKSIGILYSRESFALRPSNERSKFLHVTNYEKDALDAEPGITISVIFPTEIVEKLHRGHLRSTGVYYDL